MERFRQVLAWMVVGATALACGSSQRSARVVVLEEIGPSCADPAGEPVQVVAVSEPVRPQAVGYWVKACDPAHPGRLHRIGFDAFVYDGAYVVAAGMSSAGSDLRPPLLASGSQRAFRLETEWQGSTLYVRMPSWMHEEVSEGPFRLVPVGTWVGDHFVHEGWEGLAYFRSDRALLHWPWSELARPRTVTQAESSSDWRYHRVRDEFVMHTRACAERLVREEIGEGIPEQRQISVRWVALVAEDGSVRRKRLESDHRFLQQCGEAALTDFEKVDGYSADFPEVYRFHYWVQLPAAANPPKMR